MRIDSKRARSLAPLALWLVVAVGVGAATPPAKRAGEYHPVIEPDHFQTKIDNPYFPLVPGTTYEYVEREGRHVRENQVTVTPQTKVVMGVPCVVVHDVEREGGRTLEDTFDWYAQDDRGNVWYFGEETREYRAGGKIDTRGSWEAGLGRNQPGIIMPGHPIVGAPYRQEYCPGRAEDMGQVVAINDSVRVRYGNFSGCVRTRDWSLIERGYEYKWYALGIGVVRTQSSAGEVAQLIAVTKP